MVLSSDDFVGKATAGDVDIAFDIDGFLGAVEEHALFAEGGAEDAARFLEALREARAVLVRAGELAQCVCLLESREPGVAGGIAVPDFLAVAAAACEVGINMADIKRDVAEELGLTPDEVRALP